MRLKDPFSLFLVARVCGGRLVRPNGASVDSVSIDTRNLEKGALFFALAGGNCDGSRFVPLAESLGARAAVIAESRVAELLPACSIPLIAVKDTLGALQRFSACELNKYTQVEYVGVTGSCGKSTTKEAISAILSVHGNTVKTPGNLNSEIGLPLSVLQVGPDTRYGVFEMGVDHVGEMGRMLDVMKPDVAVLTNIGISHLEKFHSRRAIAHEKGKIFHPGIGAGFISRGCPFTRQIEKERGFLLGSFDASDLLVEDLGLDGWRLNIADQRCVVHVFGRHLLHDIAAAVRVARYLGVPDVEIAEGLDGFRPMEGRATVLNGEVTIIEDCYNASFDSTSSMLDTMAKVPWKGAKKVVLGTMKELGSASVSAHLEVARRILRCGFDGAFLYGKEMCGAYELLKRSGYQGSLAYTDDFDDLRDQVIHGVRRGDLCLIKGSRSMAMERLIPFLRQVG